MVELDITHISPKIPPNIKEFDFSYITRYAIVSELIKQAEKKSKRKFKILDVGGYNGALEDFLPEADITIVDMADSNAPNYVKTSGADMPFEDGSFDVVVTCDTLEHIPGPERDKFIKELLRVSNKYCFLCAPFDTPGVAKAEYVSNAFYRSMTGEDYIWLKEHAAFVLAKKPWLETLLKNQKMQYTSFSHTSIDVWSLMLCASFFLAGNISAIDKDLGKRLLDGGFEYLKHAAFSDFPENGYRTFFVISKDEKIEVKLPTFNEEKVQAAFNAELTLLGTTLRDYSAGYGAHIERLVGTEKKLMKTQAQLQNARQENEVIRSELQQLKERFRFILNLNMLPRRIVNKARRTIGLKK